MAVAGQAMLSSARHLEDGAMQEVDEGADCTPVLELRRVGRGRSRGWECVGEKGSRATVVGGSVAHGRLK